MNIGGMYAVNGRFEVEAMSTAVIQIAPVTTRTMEDVDKNIVDICEWMGRAVAGFPGLDLLVTPEFALQGISGNWLDTLLDLDSAQVRRLCDRCRELDVWGVFDVLVKEYHGHKGCNVAILVNNEGRIVHTYSKMNPWVPSDGSYPGCECPVADGPKGSKIGIIICADGDYPEIWREAAFNGANVIIRVTHYGSPADRGFEITNRAGAYCNQVYVVACNSIDINATSTCFGKSMMLNPDGTVIVDAPAGVPWIAKADLYPQIVDKIHEEAVTNNFLWNFRNRGAAHPEVAGEGRKIGDYSAYRL